MASAVTTVGELDAALSAAAAAGKYAVINFWASWAEPCAHMNTVFDELARATPALAFVSVEAENVAEAAEYYEVDSVPYFVFVLRGKVEGRVAGADAGQLTSKVRELAAKAAAVQPLAAKPAAPGAPLDAAALDARIRSLITKAKCVAFIKGTPSQPRCGFTRQLMEVFASHNIEFDSFNILEDEQVRQGLKEFSKWPTFPQVYVDGELVGGLDIIKEIAAAGDLELTLPVRPPAQTTEERIKAIITKRPVMLFMKGSPDAVKCGFSRQMIEVLRPYNIVDMGHFDVLSDQEIREGVKKYSNWPTFPQLYVNGELLGGVDIIKEMDKSGDLAEALKV